MTDNKEDKEDKEYKNFSIKSPTFSMEVIEKPIQDFTKEQWNLRHDIEIELESCGYDHLMNLKQFEDMLDDIIHAIEKHKKPKE